MNSAWELWKDIAYPGRVHVPGADGKVHVYDFTPRDIQLLEQSGNAKVGDGWNVPVCWEHQDVEPNRAGMQLSQNPARDMALGVFARIKKFARTPDGRLKALLAGSDQKDREQLEKVGFVSPEIVWNWRDTDGHLWRGPSVTHLAATPRPVQRHQHPVGSNPDAPHPGLTNRAESLESLVRLSLWNSQSGLRVAHKLRLSLDHYAGQTPGGARPMADDTDTPGDDAPSKKQSPWEKIAASLSLHCGLQLGDVSTINTPDEFARLVDVAAMNYKAGSEPDVPEEEDDLPPEEDPNAAAQGDMEQPPAGAEEAPSPPVQMSLTDKNKVLADKLIASERAKLVARAEKVARSGALHPADADELVEECRSVRLSLTEQGGVNRNDTITKLEAFERVKAGTAVNLNGPKSKQGGKKTRLSQNANKTRAADASPYQEDPELDEDQIVSAFERAVGRGE